MFKKALILFSCSSALISCTFSDNLLGNLGDKTEVDSSPSVAAALCTDDSIASPAFTTGQGSSDDPYIVCNLDQLQLMGTMLDKHYELGLDIDASATNAWTTGTSGTGFIPIGDCGADYNCSTSPRNSFSGSFNGNGFTIDGLFIDRTRGSVALFGHTSPAAVITNINLTNANIKGSASTAGIVARLYSHLSKSYFGGSVDGGAETGGLVGEVNRATVSSSSVNADVVCSGSRCGGAFGQVYGGNSIVQQISVSGTVTGSASQTGGVIGRQNYSEAESVSSSAVVVGTSDVGGISGHNYGGDIERSSFSGSVTGTGSRVGGISGYFAYYAEISDSFSTGDITGNGSTGGLIGQSYNYVATSNSFASGAVDGGTGSSVGAFAGVTDGSSQYSDSFATGVVSGTGTNVGGFIGSGSGSQSNTHYDANPSTFYPVTHPVYNAGSAWSFSGSSLREIWASTGLALPAFSISSDITTSMAGAGTESNPFIITTPTEFSSIQSVPMLQSYFKLGANLDFSSISFSPIGGADYLFSGGVDGAGYTISNITYDAGAAPGGLIIGGINAKISDLSIASSTFSNGAPMGAVLGRCVDCALEKINLSSVTVNGATGASFIGGILGAGICVETSDITGDVTVTANSTAAGGLIGSLEYGFVKDSSVAVNLTASGGGSSAIGGIIGQVLNGGSVSNTSVTGSITGISTVGGVVGFTDGQISLDKVSSSVNLQVSGPEAGGLIGSLEGSSVISSSASSGDINGSTRVGGLVGYYTSDGEIKDSYSTSAIVTSTGTEIGGLIGYNFLGIKSITNTYFAGSIAAAAAGSVGALVGRSDFTTTTVSNSFSSASVTEGGAAVTTELGSGSSVLTNTFVNTDETVFYTPAHPVYNAAPVWDFANIWNASGASLPVLQ